MPVTRRKALAALASAGAAGGALAWWRPWDKPVGANGDIRVGFIGLRGRGAHHVKDFRDIRGVRIAALCDVDQEILDREVGEFREKAKPAAYRDFRKLLEDKDVDAVVIATPNHWHGLMGVMAMEAGKDVYVEKPLAHNIWEGRQLVETAGRTGRIAQTGTQFRSENGFAEAIAWLREGHLGKIDHIRSVSYKLRGELSKRKSPLSIPATIDYDLWCGPAEKKELYRSKLHYDWHWFWNTGNGDLGNMGVHDLDVARWILGEKAAPPSVQSWGGRFAAGENGETPNSQITLYRYPNAPIIHEVRGLSRKPGVKYMDHYRGLRTGNVVHCEGGYLANTVAYDPKGKKIRKFGNEGGAGHQRNWLEAVAAQDPSHLNAPVEEGHVSTSLCHMGNISYRLAMTVPPEPGNAGKHRVAPPCREAIDGLESHLASHAISVEDSPVHAGPLLAFDPASERFLDNDQANALLSRKHRAPYTFPSIPT